MPSAPRPGSPPRIALVGLPGSGKSRVGRLLAEGLGAPFLDTDALVETQAEITIPEIFRGEGEPAFRELERTVLAEAARLPAPLVVATGGGIVEQDGNRKTLKESFFVVWLRVTLEVALERLGEASDRPLLADRDVRTTLSALAARRAPLYRDVADEVVEAAGDAGPEALTAAILRLLPGASS